MSAMVDALLAELDDQALARLARRLTPYLDATARERSPLLTADEAATVLRCRRRRIYELTARGALPSRRDGGRLLIHRNDLDAYVKEEV